MNTVENVVAILCAIAFVILAGAIAIEMNCDQPARTCIERQIHDRH